MTRKGITATMKEVERVLKPEGLCYVNFRSVDDSEGNTLCKPFLGNTGFSYYEDNEPNRYFGNFRTIHKEKRITERTWRDKILVKADIEYIAKKDVYLEDRSIF